MSAWAVYVGIKRSVFKLNYLYCYYIKLVMLNLLIMSRRDGKVSLKSIFEVGCQFITLSDLNSEIKDVLVFK